ncbi:poly(A) polymerase Cid14 [Coprinellus micaceus]|uniref:polynucleotide adenylyltransferase n=1 Tax=Coprinellus micaceus TaxID=71717 RepID=A0A4Y7SAY1_COPMI|nr:poly(A) polymerase Cid14 [Coprinellus micaceus]
MSRFSVGAMLKENIMDGRPSRMKSYSDYEGLVIPPCGDFTPHISITTRSPWMPVDHGSHASRRSSSLNLWDYMAPTREEKALREDLVARITKLIQKLAPGATVCPVGSYITKLYFPTSDIDMVISFNQLYPSDAKTELQLLEYKIRRSGFAGSIDSVLQASTPLLRVTDATTGLEVDLTADDGHGRRATNVVSSWLRRDESGVIRSLVTVLKMFLSIRRLGTTFTGGINSYVLVWMVAAYVKLGAPERVSQGSNDVGDIISRMSSLHVGGRTSATASAQPAQAPKESAPALDLGDALLGFLRFYGRDFDYATKVIQFSTDNVRITSKPLSPGFSVGRYRTFSSTTQQYLLHITDPACPTTDMGCKAYGIKHARETFRDAHDALVELLGSTKTRVGRARTTDRGLLGNFMGGDFSNFVAERRRIAMSWKGRH